LKTLFSISWKISLVLPENKLPKQFWRFLGLGENRTEPTELIEAAVDRLLAQGKLNLNGYTLYIS